MVTSTLITHQSHTHLTNNTLTNPLTNPWKPHHIMEPLTTHPGISDLGVETLCKGLRVCSSNVSRLNGTMSLRVLRLNRNRIGDAGAVALSYLISHGGSDRDHAGGDGSSSGMSSSLLCFSLEELSLADNPIGALGIAALLQAASPTAINHNNHHSNNDRNGHYHVSQGRPSSSSSSHPSKLSYTGASALRRLSLAHTNFSLVSLHDIGTTSTSIVYTTISVATLSPPLPSRHPLSPDPCPT